MLPSTFPAATIGQPGSVAVNGVPEPAEPLPEPHTVRAPEALTFESP